MSCHRMILVALWASWIGSGVRAQDAGNVTVVVKEPTAIPQSVLKSEQKNALTGAVSAKKDKEVKTGDNLEDVRKLLNDGFIEPKFIGAIDLPVAEMAKSWAYYKTVDSVRIVAKPSNLRIKSTDLESAIRDIST